MSRISEMRQDTDGNWIIKPSSSNWDDLSDTEKEQAANEIAKATHDHLAAAKRAEAEGRFGQFVTNRSGRVTEIKQRQPIDDWREAIRQSVNYSIEIDGLRGLITPHEAVREAAEHIKAEPPDDLRDKIYDYAYEQVGIATNDLEGDYDD